MKKKLKYIPIDYYEKLSKNERESLLDYRNTSQLVIRKEKSLIK